MSFTIKQVETSAEFSQYYQLRWELLRAPWGEAKGSEVDDIENQCFHALAADKNNKVIGIARLQFNSDSEAQIRYMAVSEQHQQSGIGSALLKFLESHAKELCYTNIVLDARESALGFYLRSGYEKIKKSYLLFNEIQHYKIQKTIK